MFTINIYLRFALIALFMGGGIILAIMYGFWYALPLLLIGLGFIVSYILLGTVQSAAQFIQTMDFEGAEKRLDLTPNPNWLYKTNRAFYYIMKGTISMHRNDQDAAEAWLTKAQAIDLPTENEKAMVELQLANIHATKNRWNKAKLHFNTAKKLKITEPQLKEQLKQFEKVLTNRGQMKHAVGMKGGRRGFRQRRIKK
ncbi:MAG: hypothetical protein AAFP19_26350 [Bacteroidota bacterium]